MYRKRERKRERERERERESEREVEDPTRWNTTGKNNNEQKKANINICLANGTKHITFSGPLSHFWIPVLFAVFAAFKCQLRFMHIPTIISNIKATQISENHRNAN